MAKKPTWGWVSSPAKPKAPSVPASFKAEVSAQVNAWVEAVLKPKFIEPPPPEADRNYLVDIQTKWNRQYFYLESRYRCPSPNAISPEFDLKFARLEYVQPGCFNLSFQRHTGQWFGLLQGASLEECLTRIESDPLFMP